MMRQTIYDFLSSVTPDRTKGRIGYLIFRFVLMTQKLWMILGILVSERVVEYPWVLSNLGSSDGRVLDVGCSASYLSHELIRRGYDTYGLDANIFPHMNPKLHFVQADVRRTPFEDNYFDQITVVSTLEHIGLGFYGDPTYPDGDFLAMLELRRILKKGGKVLLTVPIAAKHQVFELMRTYDKNRLCKLTDTFDLIREDCFILKGKRWVKVPIEMINEVSPSNKAQMVACLVVGKPMQHTVNGLA
jgi:SAM-dependent methyltransferase